jgi:transposase
MSENALLLELEATRETLRRRDAELSSERAASASREAELRTQIETLLCENADLRARVDWFARRMFGKSSERIDPRQLALAFEAAQAEALEADRLETAAGEETEETPARRRPVRKRPSKELARRVVEVDPPDAERVCACGKAKERIGSEVSEQIDYVPSSALVVETRRHKYACRACQGGVAIAPPPPTAIEKSVAAPGLVAHVLTSKYADHLPLYRQEGILERLGIDLSRSTMKDLVAASADRLLPVAEAIKRSVLSGRVVQSDDTPVTYLEAPRGSATGYAWVYVGEKMEVAFDFTPGRARDGPIAFVGEYRGYFQADAYAGYDELYRRGEVVEVACWAHARRHFVDALTTDAKAASEVLALIGRLYDVERRTKEKTEPERQLFRLRDARPVLDTFRTRLDALEQGALPKGPLGQAIGYTKRNWEALLRYLEAGYLQIDNNAAERALRAVAVGRKNWLFAGSLEAGRRAATLMTLVGTCKLNGVDPFAYLRDVLVRRHSTPSERIYDLTPRGWKAAIDAGRFTP